MFLKHSIVSLGCSLAVALAAPAMAGTITGTVKFEGDVPTMRPLLDQMKADPVCIDHHKDDQPVNEALVLGKDQTMGNVYVHITKGLPEGKEYPTPAEPAVLTQEGCMYKPHVFVVRLGQSLKVLNPDGTMHNVNGMPKLNKAFNRGMPKNLEEIEVSFDKVEDMFPIKCNVHPWMSSWAAVTDNPYFAVTKPDGTFKIEGLPAGEYELTTWHESLKEQKFTVKVPESGDVVQDVTYVYKKKAAAK